MSQWARPSRTWTFILIGWAVAAAVVALWNLQAATLVCVGGVSCFGVATAVAGRRWWVATGNAAFGGAMVLNLVMPSNSSRVEHDVVFGVGLAAVTYWLVAFAADRRTQNRRGKPTL